MNTRRITDWCAVIATMGPLGYLPASGTVASLIALPFFILLQKYITGYQEVFLAVVASGVGYLIIRCALKRFKEHDPSAIVLDEVIGLWWVFCGFSVTPASLGMGFVLFRLFDITKFPFLYYIERTGGAMSILLDDVIAGLIAHSILWIFLW
jgi:phosphatidylglycerophosphatase A